MRWSDSETYWAEEKRARFERAVIKQGVRDSREQRKFQKACLEHNERILDAVMEQTKAILDIAEAITGLGRR